MAFTKYTLISAPENYGVRRASSSIKYLIYHYTGNQTDTAANRPPPIILLMIIQYTSQFLI